MSRHHDKRASEYAATLGWEVTRTANGHARMKCPYGCCLIIASTRKNGGYKNSMTRIRKCPGAADAALVKNVVDEFLSGLPPDPAVVEAWAATWTTDKTEAPQEPEATQPQTGEPKMAKRSYRPEVYELVTDFILEHPNEVITRKMIQEGTGSTFEESEQLMDIMAGIHNATIRRAAGLFSESQSVTNIAFNRIGAAGGIFYRAGAGKYVMDTGAKINARGITFNRWPVIIGSALNGNTGKRAMAHRYRTLKVQDPYTPRTLKKDELEPVETPEAETPSVTETEPQEDTRPWRPVVAEVQPGGLDDVVVIIGRSEDGTIVLQSTTEIIIAKIETTVPR
jgi:hypothetical protein